MNNLRNITFALLTFTSQMVFAPPPLPAGTTVLDLACMRGDPRFIAPLLAKGAIATQGHLALVKAGGNQESIRLVTEALEKQEASKQK